MTAYDCMRNIFNQNWGWCDEKGRPGVGNNQIRRWIQNGAFQINGEKPRDPNQEITLPIKQLVLFPKGNKVTLVCDDNNICICGRQ